MDDPRLAVGDRGQEPIRITNLAICWIVRRAQGRRRSIPCPTREQDQHVARDSRTGWCRVAVLASESDSEGPDRCLSLAAVQEHPNKRCFGGHPNSVGSQPDELVDSEAPHDVRRSDIDR